MISSLSVFGFGKPVAGMVAGWQRVCRLRVTGWWRPVRQVYALLLVAGAFYLFIVPARPLIAVAVPAIPTR